MFGKKILVGVVGVASVLGMAAPALAHGHHWHHHHHMMMRHHHHHMMMRHEGGHDMGHAPAAAAGPAAKTH